MKKKLLFLMGLFATLLMNGQGGAATNFRTGANFLGFSFGFPGSLDIRNDFNSPIQFFTNSAANERVRIFNNTLSPSTPQGGGLAISSFSTSPIMVPGSYLHIGSDVNAGGNGILPTSIGVAGWRNWMRRGTLCFWGTDQIYVGLKGEGIQDFNDKQDAVINWGDNGTGPGSGPDYLRFIFTGPYNNSAAGTQGNVHGLEVMRSHPSGRIGIGNFYNSPLFPNPDPWSRLEILSDKVAANINGNPQFRITHTQQLTGTPLVTGMYTDFHTTNLGDLNINPRNNTIGNALLKDRFVGIHTDTPGNTLEINSQLLSAATVNGALTAGFGTPTGRTGLRFSDLNSNSIVQANPGINSGVLSVNANGDVIYVPGSSPANNGLSLVNGTVQIGAVCPATAAQTLAAALLIAYF